MQVNKSQSSLSSLINLDETLVKTSHTPVVPVWIPLRSCDRTLILIIRPITAIASVETEARDVQSLDPLQVHGPFVVPVVCVHRPQTRKLARHEFSPFPSVSEEIFLTFLLNFSSKARFFRGASLHLLSICLFRKKPCHGCIPTEQKPNGNVQSNEKWKSWKIANDRVREIRHR